MIRLDARDTDHRVGARASTSRSARARHEVTPNSPKAVTMVKAIVATAKTPKSCGLRIRATIAVVPILDNRSNIVLEKLQMAPLRTFADSDGGLLEPGGPNRAIGALGAAVIAGSRKVTGS